MAITRTGVAMPIRVALNHKTYYRYSRPVTLLPHVVRLRPAPHCRTPVLSYSLTVTPQQHFLNWQQDPYNNFLALLNFGGELTERLTDRLELEVDLVAEMTVINPFEFFVEGTADTYPFDYPAPLKRELTPYLEVSPAGPRLSQLLDELRAEDLRSVNYLVQLNQSINRLLVYELRQAPGIQDPEETLEKGRGSCRDFAWLFVHVLRHLGLAARFVSGYSIQLRPDVKPLEGPVGVAEDVADLHAWTEVFLPGAGWIGMDSTSGLMAGEGHLPLACSADPINAAPVTGSFGYSGDPVQEEFSFTVSVTRIQEAPRVTQPYSEAHWQKVQRMGEHIDEVLRAQDVRLTMGGEPTFVSVDDMEGAEWNVAAVGPHKRRLACQLLGRLQQRFAPGGLPHYGQGKLYPGESLPRWALSCFWRQDGLPLWRDPRWLGAEDREYGFSDESARRYMEALARRLGVRPDHVAAGYEDTAYFLWRESRLPINVDPAQSHLDDPEERSRLARVLANGLGRVVGYSLPLKRVRSHDGALWQSQSAHLRRQPMRLVPGDSPMGYRLPLDALPWVADEDYPWPSEVDPFEVPPPLPAGAEDGRRYEQLRSAPYHAGVVTMQDRDADHSPPAVGVSAPWAIRTFLCAEAREGRLYVFLPPQPLLEDYLELVGAIEDTAAELEMPVLLEGYPPPEDSRLLSFSVTPDPGVIEVNLHPSASWAELVEKTRTLYDEARLTRLGTEKFMLDGRHCGTGGGNHLILGGTTPGDSPFLRRPDLLRSLITYWVNHPSLSYLFSGLFIGPTSQAPRLDEARHDALREMEIAFGQIPGPEAPPCPPWLVDRIFRHLLTDATGNTHRAEFCIDKLYSPDGPSGRRGLVEFRNFEMPPDWRMSLAQQLLLRALVAWMWSAPCKQRLVRWGTQLHDRFMLHHFVRVDFLDVLADLRRAGYDFEPEWFTAHFEFRFPRVGSITQQGIQLELRQALEPWHVLGEQQGPGSLVRFVDSSLERLEVLVRGMTDNRHLVTCNGWRLPLTPTGTHGEFVAAVRYRAWQPPNCLHPTIGVHAPLVFDLVDSWSDRSIGGCTYHVSHPGGRSYDRFPVNAYEAEARRAGRFMALGHTPGPTCPPPLAPDPEFPLTLDLRRVGAGEHKFGSFL